MTNTQNYEDFKRDLAVRILRRLGNFPTNDMLPAMVKALDEFLPKDESDKRGP